MAQSEQGVKKNEKNKTSKASLYKLSDPHKYEVHDEWGDVNPGSEDYSERPRINRGNKERGK